MSSVNLSASLAGLMFGLDSPVEVVGKITNEDAT